MNSKSISHTNKPLQCGKAESRFSLLLSLLAVWLFAQKGSVIWSRQEKRTMSSMRRQKRMLFTWMANLTSGLPAGISVLAGRVGVAVSNRFNVRTVIGIVLVLYVAPESEYLYLHFDHTNHNQTWYYETWFWFWMCQGPYLNSLITWIGAYLVFCPMGYTRKSYLLAFPIGWQVAKIVWLCFVVSHTEFHSRPTNLFICYGLLIAVAMILAFQFLEHRLHHRTLKYFANLDGLCQIVDPTDAIQRGFRDAWKQLRTQNY
jgi:hypothetical protein